MQKSVRNVLIGLCVAATILFVSSTSARAQVAARSIDLAGTVGVSSPYYSVQGESLPITHDQFSGGFSGGYNLTSKVTLLGEYNYTSLGSVDDGDGGSISYHTQTSGGAARYNFLSSHKVVPYALVGVGNTHFTMSDGGQSLSFDGYNFSFGGGASIFLGKNWGIRPEYRYQHQHINLGADLDNVILSGNVSLETVSVFYQFGGKKK